MVATIHESICHGISHSEAIDGGDPRPLFGGGRKGFRLVCTLGFRIMESVFEGHAACLSDIVDERNSIGH